MKFEEAYLREQEQEIEKHLRKVWKGEIQGTFSCIANPRYRQVEDEDEYTSLAVENILDNSRYPGYNPPRLLLDFGTVSTASYWGGKIRKPVGGFKYIDPVIHDAEEAFLREPADAGSGDAAKAVRLYRRVCEKLGTTDLYCSTIDFQGPLNTAALLWEQSDFMIAMCETPQLVHKFLDRVTDHLIRIMHYMIRETKGKICSNCWPYVWLPNDTGICMTEDYMPLLSAEMYQEFGIPYVERISREFGGVFLHCCGEYEHQIPNLLNSDIHLLGLEFHYPHTRPEVLFEAFGDKVLFVPYIAPRGYDTFSDKPEYFQYLKKVKGQKTRLWFILDPEEQDFARQLEIVETMVS